MSNLISEIIQALTVPVTNKNIQRNMTKVKFQQVFKDGKDYLHQRPKKHYQNHQSNLKSYHFHKQVHLCQYFVHITAKEKPVTMVEGELQAKYILNKKVYFIITSESNAGSYVLPALLAASAIYAWSYNTIASEEASAVVTFALFTTFTETS